MRRNSFVPTVIIPSSKVIPSYEMTACQDDDIATVEIPFQVTDLPDLMMASCLLVFPNTDLNVQMLYLLIV